MFLDQIQRAYSSDRKSAQPMAPTWFRIEREEIFGVIGFKGAGKDILLRLVELLGEQTGGRRGNRRERPMAVAAFGVTWQSIGMISQQFNLLHHHSALSNVAFPLEIAGVPARGARARAAECLEWVGLTNKFDVYPTQLSDRDKRLVTVARALALRPEVLLCDEPTSGLEPVCAQRILSTLQAVNRDYGLTILIATGALDVARRICHAVAIVENGCVAEQVRMADLYAAPRTRLGRLLFGPHPGTKPRPKSTAELTCA